jgi:hypothetical protein
MSETQNTLVWSVAIYLVDRKYGGPEEGGWWYDAGKRVDSDLEGVPGKSIDRLTGSYPESDVALYRMNELQKLLDNTINVGRRDIGSVLSTGQYRAQIFEGLAPERFPTTRPHYE